VGKRSGPIALLSTVVELRGEHLDPITDRQLLVTEREVDHLSTSVRTPCEKCDDVHSTMSSIALWRFPGSVKVWSAPP
jgi:hypothetical protein